MSLTNGSLQTLWYREVPLQVYRRFLEHLNNNQFKSDGLFARIALNYYFFLIEQSVFVSGQYYNVVNERELGDFHI